MRRLFAPAALVLGLVAAAAPAHAAPREVTVTGLRVHVRDILPSAEADVADADLGPAPIAGASRLISKADVLAAFTGHTTPKAVPDMVRVVRKTRHVSAPEMDSIVRGAIGDDTFRPGVSLSGVRAERNVDIAEGWTRVTVETPRPPKKVGPFATTAIVTFLQDAQILARIPVPVDLAVSVDGAAYDLPRGGTVTLVLRRSLVEVRVAARAGADADVGDALAVHVGTSGRTMRARLTSKDEALALE